MIIKRASWIEKKIIRIKFKNKQKLIEKIKKVKSRTMFDIYTFFGISFSMNDHQKMFEDILWFWRMKKEFVQYMKEKKIKTLAWIFQWTIIRKILWF